MAKKRHRTGNMQRPLVADRAINWSVQQGKNFFVRRDYQAAIRSWETARQQPDHGGRLDQALAEAYFRYGQQVLFQDPSRGIEGLTQAAELMAADARYAYHVGLAWHRQEEFEKAVDWYQEALRRDAGFRRAYYPLAIALAQSGQDVAQSQVWQKLDEVQRARLEGPVAGDTVSQGMAEAARGDWEKARRLLDEGQRQPVPRLARGLAHYYLGVIAQRGGDAHQALEQWEKAFDTGQMTLPLLNNLLLAYTLRAEAALMDNRPADVLVNVAKGLAIQPDHKRLLEIKMQAHLEAGFKAAETGDWRRATQEWSGVGDAGGPSARSLAANVAIAHEKLEAWVDAAEAWREFARRRPRKEGSEDWLSPEQVARLWSRVSSLYIRAGLSDEAIATLQTALKYQPDDAVLGLSLARCYINEERLDAAQNQIKRVLEQSPQNVEALALDAEVAEAAQRSWFLTGYLPGIAEWEKVLATGDETYAPLARQRLVELYGQQFELEIDLGQYKEALKTGRRGLEYQPDNHFFRARYVYALLQAKAPRTEVDSQIALIDLTDQDALHQLIDNWHRMGKDKEAAILLQKAEALKPLDAEFYLGIAGCALRRRQKSVAQTYLDDAVRRAADARDRKQVRVNVGLVYAENGMEDEAEKAWLALLAEDPAYGPAHLYMAILEQKRGQSLAALKHLRQAEQWARVNRDTQWAAKVRQMRIMFNSPLRRMLPSLFDPTLPLELPDILDEEDFGDEADWDDVDRINPIDMLDNLEDYEPQTDRRRRRKKKRGGIL